MAADKKFYLVDDHGSSLGFYPTREAAEEELDRIGNPDDVGIIEIDKPLTRADYVQAWRNWMTSVINHRWPF